MTTRYYGPRDKSRLHWIPIYDINYDVVVCRSIPRAIRQKRRSERLGGAGWRHEWTQGLCVSNGPEICCFLKRDQLSHELIGHELAHVVQAIGKLNNLKMGRNADREAIALLAGYVAKLTYQDLKDWKEKIK